MKLYKNTLMISIIVFVVCVSLSFVFEFTCISNLKISSLITNYMIGIACSVIVVIITTFLQFKYEQRKLMNSIVSDTQFLFLHCVLVAISFNDDEITPDKLWEYYYDNIYDGIKKISSELLNIEWFSKTKRKATDNLRRAVLQARIDIAKSSGNYKERLLYVADKPWLKEIKDNVIFLASYDEHATKDIAGDYEKIQREFKNLNVVQTTESCSVEST